MTADLRFCSIQHPSVSPYAVYAVFSPSKPYVPTIICSLPNLQDLTVTALRMSFNNDAIFQPLTSPPLTGTLTIACSQRMEHLVARLLSLPNGIHFRKFKFLWDAEKDVRWVMALVEACSDTLKHIDLQPHEDGKSHHSSSSAVGSRLTRTCQNQRTCARPRLTSPRQQN